MSLWLQRSHGDHSYWDVAAANFKHAIGLSCELVVEHVNSFIHSGDRQLHVCVVVPHFLKGFTSVSIFHNGQFRMCLCLISVGSEFSFQSVVCAEVRGKKMGKHKYTMR